VQEYHPRFLVLSGVAMVIVILAWVGVYMRRVEREQRPNPLSRATSPYLRLCQHQLVEWRPWGEEVFLKTEGVRQGTKRPSKGMVLIDVGAHWSGRSWRVNGSLYQDPQIADLINQNFVPVKIDADARPKLVRYLRSVAGLFNVPEQYPFIVILTRSGKPLAAFAPSNRALVIKALEEVVLIYRADPERFNQMATSAQEMWLGDVLTPALGGSLSPELYNQLTGLLVDAFAESAIPAITTGSPNLLKNIHLMLFLAENGSSRASRLLLDFLIRLYNSPLHDIQAGGFFTLREGVENGQAVGGKRLVENAKLLDIYSRASQLTTDPLFIDTANEILNFLRTQFWSDRPPGFQASQCPPEPVKSITANDTETPQDSSFYASGNAIALRALLTYVQVFGTNHNNGRWALQAAQRTFETLRSLRSTRGELYHSTRRETRDWLQDEAQVLRAALALYRRTANPQARSFAKAFLNHLLEKHADPTGGFYDISIHGTPTASPWDEPIRSAQDEDFASDNALMALALLEADEIFKEAQYGELAAGTLQAFAGSAKDYGVAAAGYTEALGAFFKRFNPKKQEGGE
jgi:uncharacterized protein YyaL (SSP411 family)